MIEKLNECTMPDLGLTHSLSVGIGFVFLDKP